MLTFPHPTAAERRSKNRPKIRDAILDEAEEMGRMPTPEELKLRTELDDRDLTNAAYESWDEAFEDARRKGHRFKGSSFSV